MLNLRSHFRRIYFTTNCLTGGTLFLYISLMNIKSMQTKVIHIILIFLYLVLCNVSLYFIINQNRDLTVQAFTRSTNAVEKVIIDTDAGADDAVAIFLTLQSECKGIDLLAITCTYGNTLLENVVTNVLKILTIANKTNIPVYKGAEKPLLNKYMSDNYFGSDGFGDFNFTEKITAKVDESKHAAIALVDLVKQYPDEITLLSLGPSTNVATAIALEPSFLKYLKNHVILGSSVAGIGNYGPNVEFNFGLDPESNYIILNQTKSTVLFPWETVLKSYISKDWRKNVLGKVNSTIIKFINKADRVSLEKSTRWSISDGMAAAVMIWPKLVTKSTVENVSPVIDGMARGSVIVDYSNTTGKLKNVEIVQSFNVTAFKEILLEIFS